MTSKTVNPLRLSHSYRWHAVSLACTLALAGCASIDNVKGNWRLKNDQVDEGLQDLNKASKRSPTDAGFKVDYLLKRDEQLNAFLVQADSLRAQGKLVEATDAYSRVLQFDANNAKAMAALNGLKQDARYLRLLTDGESFLSQGKWEMALDRATQVLENFPKNQRAQKLKDAATDAKVEQETKTAKERAGRFVLDTPVTLHFSDATLRSVFEALSKSTGINILFDRDVKQENKATIFVKDVSVSDAVDLILMQNQLRKRVINGNTLMIYPANSAKQDEYEDLNIKTFQITNADVKYLANMLKTMLKLKDMSGDERTGILVIRDTPETLRMAERLIAAHDVPDPEIMLEVEVLEVSEGRDSNLGLKPPTSVTITTPGTGNSLTLGQLQSLSKDDLLVSQLSTTLNFKLEDTDAKILASPRIRARNKEPAKIMIGDRVPTVTNTVTPVSTGPAVVTGNVTYQDVGLKLEFQPEVYSNSEVGIKISLEVSSIAKEFADANGGRSYQIGTRNASTNLRLKDGETQILGGLITDQDRNTASKIPGLGHLPVVGRLFGNNAGTTGRSQIVLAITPRIVRNLAVRDADVKNIFSGTYNVVREKPILADPVSELKVLGTFSPGAGSVGTGAASGTSNTRATVFINPQSATTPLPNQGNTNKQFLPTTGTTQGQGNNPTPLPSPPPMFMRPTVTP